MNNTPNLEKQAYIDDIKAATEKLISLIDLSAGDPEWDEQTYHYWELAKEMALLSAEQASKYALKYALKAASI